MSDSLQPHESQHVRPPCPSPTPRVHPNPCPSSRWCHPAISSSGIPFSSCPQSFPALGSFPMSQLFASGSQSTGVSASASVFPMNTQDWSPSGWTGWISLQSKGPSRVFFNPTVQKHQFFGAQLSSLSNFHMTTRKTVALTRQTFVGKVMCLLLNMLSWLVITFLPRSKCLLISWLQSPSAMILEPQKIKSDPVSTVSPSISHEVMGPDDMILVFWMLSFKPTFSLSSLTFIKKLFSSSSLSAIRVVSSAYLMLLIFLSAIQSVALSTLWCFASVSRTFSAFQMETLYLWNSYSLFPPVYGPWQSPIYFAFMNLKYSKYLLDVNHTIFVLLCLAYFT